MIDFNVAILLVCLCLLIGFAVGVSVGYAIGRSDGVESERRWIDRREAMKWKERV
jgi:hypothetical protein